MFDNIKYFWTRTNALIKQSGKTQFSLASECDMPQRRINNLSAANTLPRADEAVKIAQALNTTVEYLVTGNAPSESDNATAEVAAIKSEILEVLNRH